MSYFRFYVIAISFCLVLSLLCFTFSVRGQDVQSAQEEEYAVEAEPLEPLAIKLSVNEVRLDVVVLDKKTGNPITDLTADDFEVSQNGKRQIILSSAYIDNQPSASVKVSVSRKTAMNLTPLDMPAADLKREDTGRSIIFIVDDLSMEFEHGYHAKMALRNFVEKQMQPSDMVAILRTGYGNSALQTFLSDRSQAIARINNMRMERALTVNPDNSHMFRIYDNQLSALSYSLRILKDMPGRKVIILMTAEPTLRKPGKDPGNDFDAIYNVRFSKLADDALRAGVVVNYLNIRGLQNITEVTPVTGVTYNAPVESELRTQINAGNIDMRNLSAIINGVSKAAQERPRQQAPAINVPAEASLAVQSAWEEAHRVTNNPVAARAMFEIMLPERANRERSAFRGNVLNPLPLKTGGIIIENSNFFIDGIGREIESLIKGYYLISYVPPSDTFSSSDKEIFNRIKVNVKRRNADVHTRDGFYNRLESEMEAAAQAEHPLQKALFSPYLHTDLNVNVVSGYVRDAEAGHLVRSWIHLDPKDVKIVETKDGGARIDLNVVCLTSNTDGVVKDFKFVEHTLTIDAKNKSQDLEWMRKHGIRFAMLLPVKKTGSYYVRVAVEDAETGKVGSAYQFLEIPDVGKKELALSNIFMITSTDDYNWLISDVTTERAKGLFFPVFQSDEIRSPALRTYAPGDNLALLAILYNADEKAIVGSDVEMLFVLYKDGEVFLRGGGAVSVGSAGNLDGIPLLLRMPAGIDIPPGEYVLRLIVTDTKNSTKKEGVAAQIISFTVVENQTCETGGNVCVRETLIN